MAATLTLNLVALCVAQSPGRCDDLGCTKQTWVVAQGYAMGSVIFSARVCNRHAGGLRATTGQTAEELDEYARVHFADK